MNKNKLMGIVKICKMVTVMSSKGATENELVNMVSYLIAFIDEETDKLEAFKDLLDLKNKYQL